jgi:Predicted hydrolases or acyltransferases (alpha/beta hydrolase superfamily)
MKFSKVKVNGLNVFYRESGSTDKPVFLLLHGFPTASHMFRNLMPMLENDFHVIAPDFIGFGQSDAPKHTEFDYTFENLTNYVDGFLDAMGINKFYMYVFDYGAPIGFNLAVRHPERILGIVSQNGNIYLDGLGSKWDARKDYWNNPTKELRESYKSAFKPETIIGQYTNGEETGSISPDGYTLDIHYTELPGYAERQSDLIFDYQNNVKNYPKYQAYVRDNQPEIIAAWGKNDPSFVYPGAEAFAKDDKNVDVHLLNGGHFVLESHWQEIGKLILEKWAQDLNNQ